MEERRARKGRGKLTKSVMKRVAMLVRVEVQIEFLSTEDVVVGLVSVDDPDLGLGVLVVFEDGSEDLEDGSDA